MKFCFSLALVTIIVGTGIYVPNLLARTGNELTKKSTWTQPTSAEVKAKLEQWLTAIKADDATKQKALSAWGTDPSPGGDELLLERTAAVLAAVDNQANEVVNACRSESVDAPKRFAVLFDDQSHEFLRLNLRILYGRFLAQHSHFDEALEHFAGITPQQVVDPTALLFYQCIAQHRLLQKDECLQTLAKLMENDAKLPRRYRTLAQLMEADIKPLKADTLDEVARLMDDIQRRLNLGHAGKRVRKEEDDVVAKLDKMIEDLEQQQKQQQASGAGSGGNQSSNPAQDSQPLGGRGPGDVDQKKIANKSGWGNLPPKEREEALQQISKDLPAHFREVIEEYFRKLAREGNE
jgi:hypothetical protein